MESIIATASKVFKSDRLVYRAFDSKDEKFKQWFHEQIANDPVNDALGMASLPKPQTTKQSEDMVDGISKALLAVTIWLPAVPKDEGVESNAQKTEDGKGKNSKTEDELIGFVCLGGPPHMAHHQGAGIAISLADKYQGRGYGGEAINWIVDWGFNYANLHRIHISAVSYNDRAVALYQKLGFLVEGRERDRIRLGRKRYDMVNMSMLAPEWEELKNRD